jgi:hypothetical protein
MMAAIRNFGKTSDKFQQYLSQTVFVIDKTYIFTGEVERVKHLISSGATWESIIDENTWAFALGCWEGGIQGFRRIDGNRNYLDSNVYMSPGAVANAAALRKTTRHPSPTKPGNGFNLIIDYENNKTLNEWIETREQEKIKEAQRLHKEEERKEAERKEAERKVLLERKAEQEKLIEEHRVALEQSMQALAALQHEIEAL